MYPRKFPKLDVQVKCTSAVRSQVGPLSYALEVKNYNKLQGADYDNARILVVFYVPEEVESWLEHSEDELVMRHCGYWVSLRHAAATSNSHNRTIQIPRENVFTVEALHSMMDTIGNGEFP